MTFNVTGRQRIWRPPVCRKVPRSKRTLPALLEGILRRNRAATFLLIPFFAHLPDQIPSCKIFQLSIRSELRRFHLPDPLLLIPRFECASQAAVLCDRLASSENSPMDPLLLVPLAAHQWTPKSCAFYLCGPSFPHSFLIGTPTRAALTVLVGHARC
jgi:hypothetical protein